MITQVIVFLTMKIIVIDDEKKDSGEYLEAIRAIDSGALISSYDVADEYSSIVKKEIARLQFPILTANKRIHVTTFGKFEVYIDGVPVVSKYNKTRELFAFLVDKNGALSSTGEIMSALWDDSRVRHHISYLKNIRSDMFRALKSYGLEDVVVKQRGRLGIIPDMMECDYFDMISGDPKAIARYNGEYMSQYSWAEYTNGILADIKAGC